MGSISPVVILDHSNFFDTASKYDFAVVNFYDPWCSNCKELTPKYEEAAKRLEDWKERRVLLAKVDAVEEKHLAAKYGIWSYPTIKILTDAGKKVQEYKGPLDVEGITECIKRLDGPVIVTKKSLEEATTKNKNIVILGVFPKFSGVEFNTFMKAAQYFRWDYDFLTLNAQNLPDGVSAPVVRVCHPRPAQDYFDIMMFDALVDNIKEAVIPIVTYYSDGPRSIARFFGSKVESKAMLFTNHMDEDAHAFELAYREVAEKYRKSISFMSGDIVTSQDAYKYFELHKSSTHLIVIRNSRNETYVKADLKSPNDIRTWVDNYMACKITEYEIPESIPRESKKPLRVVGAATFHEVVMNSGKTVFLMLGPWCHWCARCKELHQILDKVAANFKNDDDVIVAKLYKNAHAIRRKFPSEDYIDVEDYPTMCFKKASRQMLNLYHGLITEANIIEFIKKNRQDRCAGFKSAVDTTHPDKKIGRVMSISCEGLRHMLEKTQKKFLLVVYGCKWLTQTQSFTDAFTLLLGNVSVYFNKETLGKDADVIIAMMSESDVQPAAKTDLVRGLHHLKTLSEEDEPTIYLRTARGNIMVYEYDEITEENIIEFINDHKED